MEPESMYFLLLAIIYIAFISLGLPDSLLGAGWPVMHNTLRVPISYMGIVTMIIAGNTIISSLFSDKMTRRFGTKIVTTVSVFLTAFALIGFSVSSQFWMLLLWAIPYGLGAGAIDAALNNYVALYYSSKHMSWLHCFWGVGTIVSPFIMSYSLTHSSWNNGYFTVGMIQIGIGLLLLFTLPVWKANKSKTDSADTARHIGLRGVLKIKGVPFLLIGFFAYCSAEATAMGWASTYLVEVKGLGAGIAAAFAALFYIGLTTGRFLGGFLMDRFGDRKMIAGGTVVLIGGIISLLLPIPNDMFALAGFVLIGLGCAPIYPCIIHSTPGNFGAEYSGAIIGIQMASAYVGATFVPPLFGWLGKIMGFQILPIYLLIFVVLMICMVEKTFRVTRHREIHHS